MEPSAMIIGAMLAGLTPALKETTSQAITDAYNGLKTVIIYFWNKATNNKQEASVLIENFENDPETFSKPLEKKLTEVLPNPPAEIMNKVTELTDILTEHGYNKYETKVVNSKGVQIGDGNTQTNTFN